jgi:hypothetical protein
MADDGHQVPMTTGLEPEDAKDVVALLIGDAFNQPGKHLPIRWFRLRFHGVHPTGLVTDYRVRDLA